MLKLDDIKKIILEHNIEIEAEIQLSYHQGVFFKIPHNYYEIFAGRIGKKLLIITLDYVSDYIYGGTDEQCFLKKLNELLEAKV